MVSLWPGNSREIKTTKGKVAYRKYDTKAAQSLATLRVKQHRMTTWHRAVSLRRQLSFLFSVSFCAVWCRYQSVF